HKIFRHIMLKHPPHCIDIVLCMSPVAARGEIAEPEFVLQSQHNLRHTTSDLSRDKGLTTQRTLMIEENTIAGKHTIGLAIVYSDPVCIEFGHAIGRPWIEWCRF